MIHLAGSWIDHHTIERRRVGNSDKIVEDITAYSVGVARVRLTPAAAPTSENDDSIAALEGKMRRSREPSSGAVAQHFDAIDCSGRAAADSPWRGCGSAIARMQEYVIAFDDVFADKTEAAAMTSGTNSRVDIVLVAADQQRKLRL